MLYKVVLTFESGDKILKCGHSNEVIVQYFPVMLFIMLHKVVLTFESLDKIVKCDHFNESYRAFLSDSVVRFLIFHKEKF